MGFSQALSGLNAAASSLDVLGNNIANSQTVGYKSSGAQFASVFAGAKGLGTKVSTIMQDFSDGNIETTGRELDLAISGQGFYRFQQAGEVSYSRNGQLGMTSDGYLENAQGARIMGYGIDANGNIQAGGQPQVLRVPADDMPAQPTTEMGLSFNLNAAADKFGGEYVMDAQGRTILRDDASNELYFVDSTSYKMADGPIVDADGNPVTVDDSGATSGTLNTVEYRDGELVAVKPDGTILMDSSTPPKAVVPALSAPSDSQTIWINDDGGLYSVDSSTGQLLDSKGAGVTVKVDTQGYDVYAVDGGLVAYEAGKDPVNDPAATNADGEPISLAGLNNPLQAAAVPEIDPDASGSYTYSTSSSVYDSQGNARNLTLYFTKVDASNDDTAWNEWKVDVRLDGGPAGAPTITDSVGTVRFDENGLLSRGGNREVTFDLGNEFEPLTFDLGLAGSTQFANDSTVNGLTQNGYTSGTLAGITIEQDGTIVRNYTNEQSAEAGQIVLANFRNPEGLKAVGGNAWTSTEESGQELVGIAGTGLLGGIESGAIETSNVDLAKQLVDMIVTQRAYQANSQTIKTQDEVLQASINLSR